MNIHLEYLKIADTIIQKIKSNRHSSLEEKNIIAAEEQVIRLMALLHDIGHIPYGHTIEDEFGIFASHDKHETRWEYYLGEHSNIGKIIIKYWDKEFHKRFFQLIKCEKNLIGFEEDGFMYDIVSNTVCADLLDYIQRDCFHTNLKLEYHPRFMDYFYIKSLRNASTSKNERRLAIRVYKKGHKRELRKDTISELIQLLRNRYYLGERVYYHHAKIKLGTVLAGAVLRVKFASAFNPERNLSKELAQSIQLNNDNNEDKILYNIHFLGDDELLQFIKNVSIVGRRKEIVDKINGAKKLIKMFENRIIYKQLEKRNKSDLGIDKFDTESISDGRLENVKSAIALRLFHNLIKKGSSLSRLEIEDRICEYLPEMESGDLLIYCPSFNMAMKLAKVKITDERENIFELKDFDDETVQRECESISNKHQDLWAIRVFVNPKFVDEKNAAYKPEFEIYSKLIKEYIDWQLFARDDEETKSKGNHFWKSYVNFLLPILDVKESLQSSPKEINNKVEELVGELLDHTASKNNYYDVEKKIKEKFQLETK